MQPKNSKNESLDKNPIFCDSRRGFIKKMGLGGMAFSLPMPLLSQSGNNTNFFNNDYLKMSYELLEEWGDTLLKYQVIDPDRIGLHGGILCPACSRIHGRCGDAIYPLLFLAKKTGNNKYLQASLILFEWMEKNVSLPDGSWMNDVNVSNWNGTTVFGAISLAEALYNHSDLLENSTKEKWLTRLRKAANYIQKTFHIEYNNINYPITASYALQLFGDLFDNEGYREHGKKLARQALDYITKNDKLIYGEGGGDRYTLSPKGCLPIDLGYNVEESLPSLVLYGLRSGDKALLIKVKESLEAHMEFMLPDGAWDNSWGTRSFKWTYWGGRTSKGCHSAYSLMAHLNPTFYQVALKNLLLLKTCSSNGILFGGPHNVEHGVLPCIHHIFGHANSLAVTCEYAEDNALSKAHILETKLPREIPYGVKNFSDIHTWLVSSENWLATVTGYDREYKFRNGHPSGGALSILFHRKLGPILASSMNVYQLLERTNMQAQYDPFSTSLTARTQTMDGKFMNISDLGSNITVQEMHNKIVIQTRSSLVDANQNHPATGQINCITTYKIKKDMVELHVGHNATHELGVEFILPIISNSKEKYTKLSDNQYKIEKEHGSLFISSNNRIDIKPTLNGHSRIFNYVPGMEALPFSQSGEGREINWIIQFEDT